ncbi:MAG: hypothetical protein DHS20C18_38310 [Saprospiraceae bacterium]|nr:MAG: hypothetical protein DHS20C18_38310 [Saprospiraceae bacterium]
MRNMKLVRSVLLTILLVGGLLGLTQAQAQSDHPASIDPTTKVIKLDESVPFGYLYQLDIKNMNFASKAKAEAFFADLKAELVTFTVNFDKKMVDISLNLRAEPRWAAKGWNAYFAKLASTD